MTTQNTSSNAGSTSALGGDAGTAPPPAAGVTPPVAPPVTPPATPPAGEVTPPAAGTPPPAAPPPAELELKLPEGFELDAPALDAFKAKAKEMGLDSEKANGLLSYYAQNQKAAVEAQQAAAEKVHQGWLEAQRKDPEIGGEKLTGAINDARRVVQKYAADIPELRSFLNETGIGDHPALLKFMARIGASLKEDSVAGSVPPTAGSGGRSAEQGLQELYPNSPGLFPKK